MPYTFFSTSTSNTTWENIPIRKVIHSTERLGNYAESLAKHHKITSRITHVPSLYKRLEDNVQTLEKIVSKSNSHKRYSKDTPKGLDWLLDNYHVVDTQIWQTTVDLPERTYCQLPRLAVGKLTGYARILALAWYYLEHTDCHFTTQSFCHFITCYQHTQILNIAELWSLPSVMKIVLIENLRRLSKAQMDKHFAHNEANSTADNVIAKTDNSATSSQFTPPDLSHYSPSAHVAFLAQLARRLRGKDPEQYPLLRWLNRQLTQESKSVDAIIQQVSLEHSVVSETMSNIINSLRLLGEIDWKVPFEQLSHVDSRLRTYRSYADMDFSTRNLYRSNIERIASGSGLTECELVDAAIARAKTLSIDETLDSEIRRFGDPGYHLFGDGHRQFEKDIGYRPSIKEHIRYALGECGTKVYVGLIISVSVLLLVLFVFALFVFNFSLLMQIVLSLLALIPIGEVSVLLVNQIILRFIHSHPLPGLSLKLGVPNASRTFVVIPSLLCNKAGADKLTHQLEMHYLTCIDDNVSFGLLVDGVDATSQVLSSDNQHLQYISENISALNRKYPGSRNRKRFYLLYRKRMFNRHEQTWMAWERKRGKLHELNRLLRGATDTTFTPVGSDHIHIPEYIKYVVTLDEDTQLTRGVIKKLIGKMVHPLNTPLFDRIKRRIVKGHGILQPKVTPLMPSNGNGSWYQFIFSSPGGIDPYVSSSSDVYQDLYDEGSYTGKGIYDIDAFESALKSRVPANRLLSHDLFEGIFARAGFACDVEVLESYPRSYHADINRLHRWTRGDWQLLPWLLGIVNGTGKIPTLGRWKIIDNLRRSLVQPCLFLTLILSFSFPLYQAILLWIMVFSILAAPIIIHLLLLFISYRRSQGRIVTHLKMWLSDVLLSFVNCFFILAFLPDKSLKILDALVRTLLRMAFTQNHLLQWVSSDEIERTHKPSLVNYYKLMSTSVGLVLVVSIAALLYSFTYFFTTLPFVLLWLLTPVMAWLLSQPNVRPYLHLSENRQTTLRLIARRTWRFFDEFVTPDDNMLPPDNFQQLPQAKTAHRTSPTNIGLYLLSVASAKDFGWIGLVEATEKLEKTLETLGNLEKYEGHLLNWYHTQTLQALQPKYVSSVDSGNLAGHLIALANTLEAWQEQLEQPVNIKQALHDNLLLLDAAILNAQPQQKHYSHCRVEILNLLNLLKGQDSNSASALVSVEKTLHALLSFLNSKATSIDGNINYWLQSTISRVEAARQDKQVLTVAKVDLNARFERLATYARSLAMGMNFHFLFNQEKVLLSIGYSVDKDELDAGCYDLLGSEARLASLFAIAKNDIPSKHWSHLGRTASPVGFSAALLSWSGSMFEYLMPSLVMRAPFGSLIANTNAMAVVQQRQYGRHLNVPWGISESAFNARDLEFNYQYSNFGVPSLGLKRGLADSIVVSPYSSGLAAMVDPNNAVKNFQKLEALGCLGPYGFYEAVDFTPSRQPKNAKHTVIESYMAHHQGMTIVAINNTLNNGVMRNRFHNEPMIGACESLLQERIPRNVSLKRPLAQGDSVVPNHSPSKPTSRIFNPHKNGLRQTNMLSNGRYTAMVTSAGSGYSVWKNIAITRWNGDSTTDDDGMFFFVHDVKSKHTYSPSIQPLHAENSTIYSRYAAEFADDYTRFEATHDKIKSSVDVIVTSESDGEARQLKINNTSLTTKHVIVTSFNALALAPREADSAHPAFSKMFVQTSVLKERNALIATRRKRAPEEREIWVANFAVVSDQVVNQFEFDTSRLAFIGRGKTIHNAKGNDVIHNGLNRLSSSIGAVIDPVFVLRHHIDIPAGKQVTITYWLLVASSRKNLLSLIDQHTDTYSFDRAKTMAWTQAQLLLRHLGIDNDETATFQKIATPLLYLDSNHSHQKVLPYPVKSIKHLLWQEGISGDLPIVVMRICESTDIKHVEQLLRAHEYWKLKMLYVDIVIINEQRSTYFHSLQDAIETAVRCSQSPVYHSDEHTRPAHCYVHVLRHDQISTDLLNTIMHAARLVINARDGDLETQCRHLLETDLTNTSYANENVQIKARYMTPLALDKTDISSLSFFNGTGGFDTKNNEYVIQLNNGLTPPGPWINIIANDDFGFQIAEDGNGYTWAQNSRDNQLTPWYNDPVCNPCVDNWYVRDEDTLALSSASNQPIQDDGEYEVSHGWGYSVFSHHADHIHMESTHTVVQNAPVKMVRLSIKNTGRRERKLSITSYIEWVLGNDKYESGPFITTSFEHDFQAITLSNPFSTECSENQAFVMLQNELDEWTTDRTEFLGQYGSANNPSALTVNKPMKKRLGHRFDICSAMQTKLTLQPNASHDIVLVFGYASSHDHALTLMNRYKHAIFAVVLQQTKAYWLRLLTHVQVDTPDKATNLMLNGWLNYQTMSSRILARCGFYQASGAFGFRDQLQDGMSMLWHSPKRVREHILRAASRQFKEGDVQHWWLPLSGRGVRTHISDDRIWLVVAATHYAKNTQEQDIWQVQIPFLEGPLLDPSAHDAFFMPNNSDDTASLLEHCILSINAALAARGKHGLPLIGTGDWNDGMNGIGKLGEGESVWLGWFVLFAIDQLIALQSPYCKQKLMPYKAQWQQATQEIAQAIEQHAWDGEWYRRAVFDNGIWLGSQLNDECKIDAICQSWAVLSNHSLPKRADKAMIMATQYLVRKELGLALLFTPPFEKTILEPGYIKGYPAGFRENGGQYTHAAVWSVMALCKQAKIDQAFELFSMLNPINHALNEAHCAQYKVEPYVMAADVYSVPPHCGRGGWTWYTGAAGLMYQAGLSSLLGIEKRGKSLEVTPQLPSQWDRFSVTIDMDNAHYLVEVIRDTQKTRTETTEKASRTHGERKVSPNTAQKWDVYIDEEKHSFNTNVQFPLLAGKHHVKILIKD
ncbi:glycosyl transferase [Alteromonas stellipolaris]|uniref:GH36-type glycosyl hydrolase domain-containing protein n=1 Tax=Alteromonas stellipolaris TaxID=233316 RepID=UPI002118D43F|nr:glucoamylase family protein [Alteromonas stellipolaris]MCQ8847480.1 glycosyl transferase [Alteromonas stellipolaris]